MSFTNADRAMGGMWCAKVLLIGQAAIFVQSGWGARTGGVFAAAMLSVFCHHCESTPSSTLGPPSCFRAKRPLIPPVWPRSDNRICRPADGSQSRRRQPCRWCMLVRARPARQGASQAEVGGCHRLCGCESPHCPIADRLELLIMDCRKLQPDPRGQNKNRSKAVFPDRFAP